MKYSDFKALSRIGYFDWFKTSHNLKLLVEFSILNGGKLSHLNSCLWGSVSLCMQMYPPILFQTIRNSILWNKKQILKCSLSPRRFDRFESSCTHFTLYTGWSIATVFHDFSLTDIKKPKNGQTQPFLLSWHIDILIFWCLSVVRSEKNEPFRAVPK